MTSLPEPVIGGFTPNMQMNQTYKNMKTRDPLSILGVIPGGGSLSALNALEGPSINVSAFHFFLLCLASVFRLSQKALAIYTKKRGSHFLPIALFSLSARKYKSTARQISYNWPKAQPSINFMSQRWKWCYIKQKSSKDRYFEAALTSQIAFFTACPQNRQ